MAKKKTKKRVVKSPNAHLIPRSKIADGVHGVLLRFDNREIYAAVKDSYSMGNDMTLHRVIAAMEGGKISRINLYNRNRYSHRYIELPGPATNVGELIDQVVKAMKMALYYLSLPTMGVSGRLLTGRGTAFGLDYDHEITRPDSNKLDEDAEVYLNGHTINGAIAAVGNYIHAISGFAGSRVSNSPNYYISRYESTISNEIVVMIARLLGIKEKIAEAGMLNRKAVVVSED